MSEAQELTTPIDFEQIKQLLPHRFPFLLFDRVIELEPAKRVVGIKNVSGNEWFFQGHFPRRAIMPGVLILEAMAQVGGVLVLSVPGNQGKLVFLAGIDRVRFRHPVVPGDTLRIEVELTSAKTTVGKSRCRALVEGQLVAEAEIMFVVEK